MSSMYIPLITVLGLVGVFFNLQMLFTSYRNKTKYTFLQNTWSLVICQFVYHVSVLGMNTVDAWIRLHVQQEEHCSTIYLLIAALMTFFVGGNMMVILVIESRNSVSLQNRELFPTCQLFTTAVLTLGFTVSVFVRCYTCFREQFAFHVTVISVMVAVTIVVFLLVASRSSLQLDNMASKPPIPKTSLPNRCKKKKGIVLFVALCLVCIGVSVTQAILPQAFHAGFYLLIMNATVGIALPLIFNEFVDSSSKQEDIMDLAYVTV